MAQFEESKSYYVDIFCPPTGYDYDFAELTTFSLSKSFLVQILAMAVSSRKRKGTLHRPRSTIRAQKEDPAALFHVFYNAKNNSETLEDTEEYRRAQGKLSLYLLQHCCTPVTCSGLFHPKIILVQFKKTETENEYLYRALISSKNLTWSNYFEAGVLLESCGTLENTNANSSQTDHRAGPALTRFFRKYSGGNPSRINFDVLEKTAFRVVGAECSEPELYFGQEDNLYQLIQADLNSTESPKTHMRITSMNPTESLFPSEGTKTIQYICNFKDFYTQSQADGSKWTADEAKKGSHWYVGESEQRPRALHVKQYLLWHYIPVEQEYALASVKNFSVWIGSANCSEKGLKKGNEEVLVHYTQTTMPYGDFPCNGPHNAEFYPGRTSPKIKFYHPSSVTGPEIPECDEDDFPALNVKASGSYDSTHKTLTVAITNKTGKVIQVRPATFKTGKTLNVDFDSVIYFSGMDAKNFSPLLLVEAEGDDRIYSILLHIGWSGETYDSLRSQLPPDPIDRLADLIGEPQPGLFSWSDNVYERLQKCQMKQPPDEFRQTVQTALDDLALLLTEPDPDEGNVDITVWENYEFFKKHKSEAEETKRILCQLGAEEAQDDA